MNRCLVSKLALLLMAAVMLVAVVGCGGGGGTGSGQSLTGSLVGNVFVPGTKSGEGAAYVTMDRSGAPSGYLPMVGATVSATAGGRNYTAITDGNGHFLIEGLPAGVASVRITPPVGSGYREFTTSANVASGASVAIGQNGNVSLLTGAATGLGVAVNSVDTSAWPTVRTYVSVLDPKADAALLGLAPGNFALQLNNMSVSVSVSTEMTTGANPRQVYVLTSTMTGSKAGFMRAEISANYCGKIGTAAGATGNPSAFVAPLGTSSVSYAYKDNRYATSHAGKWHMGADIPASEGMRVNAAAKGIVVLVISAMQDTGVVIRHRVSTNLTTTDGVTRDVYVLYGCITPSVEPGEVVDPGQEIGRLRMHGEGSHLHLGLRVGQTITSARGDGSLVGGLIPSADGNGLTDGWTDPIAFFANKAPDNAWEPKP